MILSMILAMNKNFVIGNDNQLPWGRHTADMFWFRKNTFFRPIIMGRKTYESLGNMVLYNRYVIVVSSSFSGKEPDEVKTRDNGKCVIVKAGSYLEAERKAVSFFDGIGYKEFGNNAFINNPGEEIMICGGAYLYNSLLGYSQLSRVYLTRIDDNSHGDTVIDRAAFTNFEGKATVVYKQEVESVNNEPAATFSVLNR